MKRRGTTILDQLLLLGALVLALFLILGILAGNTDPRTHILIAFFGLAYPFILLLNIGMLVVWLIRGRLFFAAVTVCVIIWGWHPLIATVGFTGEEGEGPKTNAAALRMMTYNVHSFKPYGEGNNDLVKHQMLEVVKKEDPDIICFQEYYSRKKGAYAITDSIKQILKITGNYFVPTAENNYEAMGQAIFSRYPIVGKGTIAFGDENIGNSAIYIDVMAEGKKLRIYNVHLQSISFDKQDYNFLEKVTQKMDPEIVPAKRILRMLKTAFIKRSAQVDMMKEHMQTCKTPFLIAGDFNDTPASYAVTQLTKSLRNSFVEQGTGLGRTYNGKFPNFQIDYISGTRTLKIINHRIIRARLSDHFPIRSDISIN